MNNTAVDGKTAKVAAIAPQDRSAIQEKQFEPVVILDGEVEVVQHHRSSDQG